jgi:hypothetical protein
MGQKILLQKDYSIKILSLDPLSYNHFFWILSNFSIVSSFFYLILQITNYKIGEILLAIKTR